MSGNRAILFFSTIVAICISSFFFTSCGSKSMEGKIIMTQISGPMKDIDYVTGDSWRYIPESRIVIFDPDKTEEPVQVLTSGFYSAMSPEISYDGNSMLFTGQKLQGDSWQIYEMNLSTSKIKQITSEEDNCIDPAYLPGGNLVFSKLSSSDGQTGYSLFTCNLDGSSIQQITFNPHCYFASSVLMDGRVLTISRQLFPEQGSPVFMVMRPDGTKAVLSYKGPMGSTLFSRPWETPDGKIVFIESNNSSNRGGNLVSIEYNRPLHSRVDLSSKPTGSFHSVFPLNSVKLLVSYRPPDASRFGLYEFDKENKTLGKAIFESKDFDVLQAVLVKKHDRPKKLPSEVKTEAETGLLLCQDINFTGIQSSDADSSLPKAARIEVLGMDSTFGIVEAKEDGSFYLNVKADTPFRIQTIDENGNVLNGPCDWIWIRPNERRGCVGCHEDPELAPDNRVPLAVKKFPVIVPVVDRIKGENTEMN